MPWLVRDGDVLASLEVADSPRRRARGLLGRDGIDGAILLQPASWVHTFGMGFDLDVAYLDGDLTVVRTASMPRRRLGMPVPSARSVLEAESGAFNRWSLTVGDQLEIRG